jgi:hypothetical protein
VLSFALGLPVLSFALGLPVLSFALGLPVLLLGAFLAVADHSHPVGLAVLAVGGAALRGSLVPFLAANRSGSPAPGDASQS